MALDPTELFQLWVVTFASIAGVVALFWQAYERFNRPRLRLKRSWGKIRSWSRVDGGTDSQYGVTLRYTGKQRAYKVSISCRLPDYEFDACFVRGGATMRDIEDEEDVLLFTQDESGCVSFAANPVLMNPLLNEPPHVSAIRDGDLAFTIRSDNVEGSEEKIRLAKLIDRERMRPD